MVGGITGGVFQFFNSIGSVFFILLIGEQRALRPQLRGDRVAVGSCLTFIPVSILICLIQWEDWLPEGSIYAVLFLGALIGLLIGLMLAGILISYVDSVDKQIEKENRFNRLYNKKYKELIRQGIDPDDAAEQARHAASESGCFIATAVYGSPNAEEVIDSHIFVLGVKLCNIFMQL